MASWRDRVVKLSTEHGHGTGFFVGEDLVLTALHVIVPDYKRGERTCFGAMIGDAEAKEAAELVWPALEGIGDEAVDAALIRVPNSQRVDDFCELSHTWSDGAEFDSLGCAEQLSVGMKPVSGKLDLRGEDDERMGRLSVSTHRPDTNRAWRGISGAPVVVANRVCGIVVLREHDRGVLDAVKIAPLLRDNAFRQLLPSTVDRDTLHRAIRRLLREPDVQQALSEVLGDDPQECLLGSDWHGAGLDAIDRVHERLQSDQSELGGKLCALCQLLLPYHAVAPHVGERGLLTVVGRNPAGKSMGIARAQGRPMRLKRPSNIVDKSKWNDDAILLPDKGPGDAQRSCKQIGQSLRRYVGLPPDATDSEVADALAALRATSDFEYGRWFHLVVSAADSQDVLPDAELSAIHAAYPLLDVFEHNDAPAPFEQKSLTVLIRMNLRQHDRLGV